MDETFPRRNRRKEWQVLYHQPGKNDLFKDWCTWTNQQRLMLVCSKPTLFEPKLHKASQTMKRPF